MYTYNNIFITYIYIYLIKDIYIYIYANYYIAVLQANFWPLATMQPHSPDASHSQN